MVEATRISDAEEGEAGGCVLKAAATDRDAAARAPPREASQHKRGLMSRDSRLYEWKRGSRREGRGVGVAGRRARLRRATSSEHPWQHSGRFAARHDPWHDQLARGGKVVEPRVGPTSVLDAPGSVLIGARDRCKRPVWSTNLGARAARDGSRGDSKLDRAGLGAREVLVEDEKYI
ncbi:hypothetical protein LXA43DRAFT_1070024 [Ganoderma leucocontextum]|nr:hypothetical protein LXA43DRAFT_1070024 [Ganoderma leucocontextum]